MNISPLEVSQEVPRPIEFSEQLGNKFSNNSEHQNAEYPDPKVLPWKQHVIAVVTKDSSEMC